MSRKEVLSQPDPSEIFAMRMSVAVDWVKDNLRYILYGVLGLVVIAAIIVAWNSWQRQRRETAAVMLHQALKLVNTTPNANETANPDEAIKQLQAITEKYGRTPAGARAYWHLGHLYFSQGQSEDALKAYEVARRRLPNPKSLNTTLALLNMGYAQESTDACGDAITTYEALQQSSIQWLRGEAYLGMGRCHEKAGDTEKAIAVYDRALADVSVTGSAQQTISERLARLQPDEPEAPATPAVESSDAGEPKTEAPTAEQPKADENQTGAGTEAETATESQTDISAQPVTSETSQPADSEPVATETQPEAEQSSVATPPEPGKPAVETAPKTVSEEATTPAETTQMPTDKPDDTTQNAKN